MSEIEMRFHCTSRGCCRSTIAIQRRAKREGWHQLGGHWFCGPCCRRMADELEAELEKQWRERVESN
jgi:hypothetical protein